MIMVLAFPLTVLLLLGCSHACYIWGTDSGECTDNSLDADWRSKNMPYCQKAVSFPVCVPQLQAFPPSREYPQGRFSNNTVLTKDAWVSDNALSQLALRMGLERNKTLFNLNVNEYGDPGHIKVRFYKSQDCQDAFTNFMCWINFPRCDPETGETLPTCRSACENFFITCGYESKLWRCGKTKYFNGYFPESPSRSIDGGYSYLREYFPGQPFHKNKFVKKTGQEEPICTPAVKGSGEGGGASLGAKALLLLLLVLLSALLS